jgi:hypothetical protein
VGGERLGIGLAEDDADRAVEDVGLTGTKTTRDRRGRLDFEHSGVDGRAGK